MAIALLVIGFILTSAPIAAALIVGLARRGESYQTLAGPAPGRIQELARHITGFHAEVTEWPQPRSAMSQRRPVPRQRPAPAAPTRDERGVRRGAHPAARRRCSASLDQPPPPRQLMSADEQPKHARNLAAFPGGAVASAVTAR